MVVRNCAVTIAVLVIGCSSSGESYTDEEYNQKHKYEKETDFDFPLSNSNDIAGNVLENIEAEITFVNESVTKECVLDGESVFRLEEQNDETILLSVLLHGILEQSDGWTTNCTIWLAVPWNVNSPPELPYTWEYQQEHLSSTEKNIYLARVYSGPTVEKQNDQDPEKYQAIYPWPPSADPHNVQFVGSTVVLPGTIADYENTLHIAVQSVFRVVDHSGNVLDINVTWKEKTDGGIIEDGGR